MTPPFLVDTVTAILTAVAARGDTITYADLLVELGAIDPDLAEQARADLAPVLRAVSIAEDGAGRGLLTAVVIRQTGGTPGGGFFRLAAERGRDMTDPDGAWVAELSAVHAHHSRRG